jgi:hypothetical protein
MRRRSAVADDTLGNEIAAAHRALEPVQVAHIIFKALFETGPNRVSSANRFIAIASITGGLIEWKKQLTAGQAGEAGEWKKKYQDAKAELDDVRLKLAILQKEQ